MLPKKVSIDNSSNELLSFLYLAKTSSLIYLYKLQSFIHGIAIVLGSIKSFPIRNLLLSIPLIIFVNPSANFLLLII